MANTNDVYCSNCQKWVNKMKIAEQELADLKQLVRDLVWAIDDSQAATCYMVLKWKIFNDCKQAIKEVE